ncbi:DUF2269 family protein [Streptomyces sp. NPDC048637]|uniref:DUF2269 family protein n=1 Tax=Streptomyces sp. NPDC048637 TaxID=3155636 RepID=UPI003429AC79
MTKLFLALHVLAAVLAVGPVTVAAGMFPRALRRAQADPQDLAARSVLRTLHRICRVYAALGAAVPVLGFATAGSLGVLGSGWLIASLVLTTAAAAILVVLVLPGQDDALDEVEAAADSPGTSVADQGAASRLMMLTGVFNLLWATVTVLMIIRPGSTTGA